MKLLILLMLMLLVAVAYSHAQDQRLSKNEGQKQFEELILEDTSGNMFNTTSLSGKIIYVDFWFTACQPCIKEISYSKALQEFFSKDTNIVFLNICIENTQRKPNWKQMVRDKQITGRNLFYALNRPQKVNLKREYEIMFPTYLIVSREMKVLGNDAPRPSETGVVQWVLSEVIAGSTFKNALVAVQRGDKRYLRFMEENKSNFGLTLE